MEPSEKQKDNQFRMSILERLEQMERRMAEMTAAQQQKPMAGSGEGSSTQVQGCAAGEAGGSFEERIIAVCEHMMASACWGKAERLVHAKSFRGMTLLHLAAAQGYTRLIQTLIKWRSHHTESIDLEFEVDPLNVDHFSCTPLMWACALGHVDAAVVLYQWNSRALSIPDSLGRLPLSVAHARGHVRLAACLDELQRQQGVDARPPHRVEAPGRGDSGSTVWSTGTSTQDSLGVPSPSFSQLSTSPDTGLSVLSSSVSSPTISDTRSPLSTHSSHGSPEQDSPLPSPDVATSQAFVSPIPAFPSSRSDPLPFAADRSGPPTAGVFAVSGTPLPANGATAAAAAGGFASRPSGAPSQRDEEMEVSSDTSAQAQAPVFLFPMAPASAARELERGSAQREAAEREMAEAELLSYSENLENEAYLPAMEVLQVDMITLAEQIIQATPERIKQENFTPMDSPLRERQGNHAINQTMAWLAGYLGDVDHLPNLSQHRSLYNEPLTPASNTSQSPVSSPLNEIAFERVETPTAADWSAFLNASTNGKMENEFSQLTLSDHEQRELYEAAKIIQTAFRKYKGRRLKEQQDMAAAVIQRCYRKYKQLTWIALKYALYKKMTQAAILIQSKFRSYYEQKRFQQSRRAAVLIQQYYRSYKEYEKLKQTRRGTINLQQKMRGSFLSKNQDQAARKIMRFLRRSRHRTILESRHFRRNEGIKASARSGKSSEAQPDNLTAPLGGRHSTISC